MPFFVFFIDKCCERHVDVHVGFHVIDTDTLTVDVTFEIYTVSLRKGHYSAETKCPAERLREDLSMPKGKLHFLNFLRMITKIYYTNINVAYFCDDIRICQMNIKQNKKQ